MQSSSWKKKALACLAIGAAAVAMPAHAGPRYPVVLVHGFIGFDNLLGTDYWYGIAGAMEKEGAKVFTSQISPSQTPEYRGEELIKILEQLKTANHVSKFNLVGHSLGGPTVRYVASVRPDLIASATTVGGTNLGSKLADYMIGNGYISAGNWLDQGGTALLKGLGFLTGYQGNSADINAMVATVAMTRAAAVDFNRRFPEGAPVVQGTPTGSENGSNGVKYFSITGNADGKTNGMDLLDSVVVAPSAKTAFQGIEADGLVELESQYWGKHLKTYPWNHMDEVNQLWGLLGSGAPSPKDVFRSLMQTLQSKGL